MTLADHTQISRWVRGGDDEAVCQECDWDISTSKDRLTLYEARRHVIETGHVVDRNRIMTSQVFLADHEPLR